MGYGKTSVGRRSESSPSLFRRLSSASNKSNSRWVNIPSPRRHGKRPQMQNVDEDASPVDGGFLPLIRVVSPLDPFKSSDQTASLKQPHPPPHGQHPQPDSSSTQRQRRRSTSWSDYVTIFAPNTEDDSITNSNPYSHGKSRFKFTLGSPSDLDLPQHSVDTHTMASSALSAPSSSVQSPSASSSSLAPAPGAPILSLDLPPPFENPFPRPQLPRRDAAKNTSRRYTFAMAMTDEHISDEVLVKELERIRAVKAWTGSNPGSDLEELWDLGGSSSQSPGFGSSEGSENHSRGFFDGALTDSPSEHAGEEYMGLAVTTDVHLQPYDSRATYRGSLPVFPVHHRMSNGSSVSPSDSAPSNSARTSMLESSDVSWHIARRALLTCRECVRTERHYLTGMRALVSQDTSTPPPIIMLRYAERLVEMSERLLARMEENPNVWGVTAAFLGEEAALEESFVGWCGRVGEWFEGNVDDDPKDKKANESVSPADDHSKPKPRRLSKPKAREECSAPRKRMSTWIPSLMHDHPTTSSSTSSTTSASSASTSVSSSAVTTPANSEHSSSSNSKTSSPAPSASNSPTITFASALLDRKRDKDGLAMTSMTGVFRQRSDGSTSSAASSGTGVLAADTLRPRSKPRKAAVRELAILPTQRVMRYVLLFRDLLAHTPSTSTARSLVQRAVDAASRIAERCDQAQNHTAFVPQVSALKNHDVWTIQRSWSRRVNYGKRDKEFSNSSKCVSEGGHSASGLDANASIFGRSSPTVNVVPKSDGPKVDPASKDATRPQMPSGVLAPPRRSMSTSAVPDALNTEKPPALTVHGKDHTPQIPNRLTKKKKDVPTAKLSPPTSFLLRTQAALSLGARS